MGVPDGPGTRTVSDLPGYLELPTSSLLSFSFWVRKGQRPAWSRGYAWLTPGDGGLLLSWGSRWQPFPSSCALGHLAPSVGSAGGRLGGASPAHSLPPARQRAGLREAEAA